MLSLFTHLLNDDLLQEIMALPDVVDALSHMQSLSDPTKYSFTTNQLPIAVKSLIGAAFPVLQAQLADPSIMIPMRWIRGDTAPHADQNPVDTVEQTFLVYVTDSPGYLLLPETNEVAPIQRGTAVSFPHGAIHETKLTGDVPRLLIGPMNQNAREVGGPYTAVAGDIIYLQEDANGDHYYSLNSPTDNLFHLSWPFYIQNTNPSDGVVQIRLHTNLTLSSTYHYISCYSSGLQIGSGSRKSDGTLPTITVDGVTDYPGFVQNGSENTNGHNNIRICNLQVNVANGTLAQDGGWVAKTYFGKHASDNYIVDCVSTGNIDNNFSGGIVGSYAGSGLGAYLMVYGCMSSGTQRVNGLDAGAQGAGGIVGGNAAHSNGSVLVQYCQTSGIIGGRDSGGIVGWMWGSNHGTVDVKYCFSTGLMSGINGGGIVGYVLGNNNSCSVQYCYTTGNIVAEGVGGIAASCQPNTGTITLNITNCYTTGNVTHVDAGAICGKHYSGLNTFTRTLQYLYTTGSVNNNIGHYVAGVVANTGSVATNVYSEALNSSSSWSDTNASSVLQNTPTSSPGLGSNLIWASTVVNTPYRIFFMGYDMYYPNTVQFTSSNVFNHLNGHGDTVYKGESSTKSPYISLANRSFQILNNTYADSKFITIDSATGLLSTTNETPITTTLPYTLYIFMEDSVTGYYIGNSIYLNVRPPRFVKMNMQPMFSDNSLVYYKPHSLPAGGVNTVRNSRAKGRKT